MLILGIDPGLTGAAALVCTQRGLLVCEDLPTHPNGTASGSMKRWIDCDALRLRIAHWSEAFNFAQESVRAVIERPIPMPSLPAQTIASQFDTFGAIRALLVAKVDRTPLYVNPGDWKRTFGLARDKADSRACCLRLYPQAPVARVKDHNRAESILIAHYGSRELA